MKKRERSGNLLDLFLVLVLVLSFCGILLRRYDLSKPSKTEDLREYTVVAECKGILYDSVECILDGEILYTAQGEIYGVLEDHDVKPAKAVFWENGELHQGYWQGNTRCDVTLLLRVNAKESDHGLLKDGTLAILCGQSVILYSDQAQLELFILDFYPISESFRVF